MIDGRQYGAAANLMAIGNAVARAIPPDRITAHIW